MAGNKTRRCVLVLLMALPFHSHHIFAQSQLPGTNSKGNKSSVLHVKDTWPFKSWLEQDAVWIITTEEKAAFKALQNDEQREQFIEAFWSRRNPMPDTYENEFKEEHYRRIAYSNDHFTAQVPGWKSDRGRIYIVYGPPDHVTTYSAQDTRPRAQDSQDYKGLPSETWTYRYLEGVGMDVIIDFVDICNCGEYQMRMPDELRDALLIVSNGLTGSPKKKTEAVEPQLYLKLDETPKVKFPELEKILDSSSRPRAIPVNVDPEVVKATDPTSIVHITISFQNVETASHKTDGSTPPTLNVHGRVSGLTGRIVERFEGVAVVDPLRSSELSIRKSFALLNGRYRLEIAAETALGEKATSWIGMLVVRP